MRVPEMLNGSRPYFVRLAEAAVIATITAVITSYVTVERLAARFEVETRYISRDIEEIKRRLEQIERSNRLVPQDAWKGYGGR